MSAANLAGKMKIRPFFDLFRVERLRPILQGGISRQSGVFWSLPFPTPSRWFVAPVQRQPKGQQPGREGKTARNA